MGKGLELHSLLTLNIPIQPRQLASLIYNAEMGTNHDLHIRLCCLVRKHVYEIDMKNILVNDIHKIWKIP